MVRISFLKFNKNSLYKKTYLTISIGSTSSHTGVNTTTILALQITATIDIIQTFATVAVCQRIATVAGRTGTDRTAAGCFLTNSIHTTRIAMTTINT